MRVTFLDYIILHMDTLDTGHITEIALSCKFLKLNGHFEHEMEEQKIGPYVFDMDTMDTLTTYMIILKSIC